MGCYLAIDNLNRIALSIKKAFTCPFSKGQVIWRFAAFFAQGKVKKVLFSKNLPAFFSFFLFFFYCRLRQSEGKGGRRPID